MFGYIVADGNSLSQEAKGRYRAFYCGLCHTLKRYYGWVGTATLSYDMTFLAILLNAFYEPDEKQGISRCLPHPMKAHEYILSPYSAYAADMNIALAYYKCQDNWIDDRNILSAAEQRLLVSAYSKVRRKHPEKCAIIASWIDEIHSIEAQSEPGIDALANSTGKMLGELFVCDNDFFSEQLRMIGDGLGRFIYFMDAYDDLQEDLKKKRFNALKSYSECSEYEALCKDALTMMVADAAQAYEELPIVKDNDILRNVLYTGIWSRYVQIQERNKGNDKGDR